MEVFKPYTVKRVIGDGCEPSRSFGTSSGTYISGHCAEKKGTGACVFESQTIL
jgi:hypothetical protein